MHSKLKICSANLVQRVAKQRALAVYANWRAVTVTEKTSCTVIFTGKLLKNYRTFLSHSMRTRQIQLQDIGTGFFCLFRQRDPVLLIEDTHNRSHHNLGRMVAFQFPDTLQPVGGGLLRNQLDIQEGALIRSVDWTAGGAANNSWRYIGHQILVQAEGLRQYESPALFESATPHRAGSRRRGRGQAEGVLKLDTAHLHGDIYLKKEELATEIL